MVNRFELIKQQKDGLDILEDIPRFARDGFASIPEDDLERLKWAGIFHRKPTPGFFMMRIRFPSGIASTEHIRVVATIMKRYGRGVGDLTTRQQIEPRWLRIEDMPAILDALASAGLTSLQTGMDNIRGVVGCPLAGVYPRELLDAAPLCYKFQSLFLGDRQYTNLPRKFNVAITGCPDNCVDAESQDVALVPAVKEANGAEEIGFNVLAGGKMGSGGYRIATPLDVFVRPEEAPYVCRELALIFRDHGPRETRSRARLAFLIEERGVSWLRDTLEQRIGHPLPYAGRDARSTDLVDHIGVASQRQPGLYSVGLVVPVGRVTADELLELARLADLYGRGEVRLTTDQNVIIPHVSEARLKALLDEPLLQRWSPDPSPALRGLIACTGTDFCNLAQIQTKDRALEVARALEGCLRPDLRLRIRWSGCPAGCGNHQAADIGLQGKRIRLPDGRLVEAVTVYLEGASGPSAKVGRPIVEDIPCDERLPGLLRAVIEAELSPKPAVSSEAEAEPVASPAV